MTFGRERDVACFTHATNAKRTHADGASPAFDDQPTDFDIQLHREGGGGGGEGDQRESGTSLEPVGSKLMWKTAIASTVWLVSVGFFAMDDRSAWMRSTSARTT